MTMLALLSSDGFDAVQARHAEVHDDYVRPVLAVQRHSLQAVGGLRHHAEFRHCRQQRRQAGKDQRVIIRDQDRDGVHKVYSLKLR
jgi:hypothetical protein